MVRNKHTFSSSSATRLTSSSFTCRNGILLGNLLTVAGLLVILSVCYFDSSLLVQFPRNLPHSLQAARSSFRILAGTMPPSSTIAKAPSKREIGNAGWTLIHSIAANYPEKPSEGDQYHAKAFLRSIGKLYPCKRCRQHFARYLAASPPVLTSRNEFLQWTCGAHNQVNKREGKPEFSCSMPSLEHRWGDCGCQLKKSRK